MGPTNQITAIQLSAGTNSRGLHHIDRVYMEPLTPSADPKNWYRRTDVAAAINRGAISVISSGGGSTAQVTTFQLNTVWYLRTRSDGTREDNLLHLKTYDAAGNLLQN
jgi:hypothetical protein